MVGRRDFRAAPVAEKFFQPCDAGLSRMKARENQRRGLKVTPSSFTVEYEELHQQA